MARTRASSKAAGSTFERLIADGLAAALDDDRIDRRVKTGAKDRGDIGGVRLRGRRVVIEAKNCAKLNLPQWTREAQLEAGNDDAIVGVVAHKRHGSNQPLEQWITMTLADFVAILTDRPADV